MTSIAHSEREIPREALAAAGVAAALAAALAWSGRRAATSRRTCTRAPCSRITGSGSGTTSGTRGATASSPTASSTTRSRPCSGSSCSPSPASRRRRSRSGSSRRANGARAARWSNRSFAVVWAGVVLSGAFPFALGIALALLALWALQAGRRGRFALLTVLVLAASPVAFVLLAVILAGIGLSRAPRGAELALPLATLAVATAVELVLLRLFPAGGRFPFSLPEFAAACVFCGLGILLTWRVRDGRRAAVDVRRLPRRLHRRVPRSLRPRREHRAAAVCGDPDRDPDALAAALAAAAAALSSRCHSRSRGTSPRSPAASSRRARTGGRPGVLGSRRAVPPRQPLPVVPRRGGRHRRPLARRLSPGRRDPDRAGLVPAGRLPAQRRFSTPSSTAPATWRGSARSACRYVVLPDAPLDYSAKQEGALISSGRSGLVVVFRSAHTTVYAVPVPQADRDRARQRPRARSRPEQDHPRPRSARPLPHRDELVAVLAHRGRMPLAGHRRDGAASRRLAPASCISTSPSTRRVLLRRSRAARSRAAQAEPARGLVPGRQRQAAERAVAEHVDGRVVDDERDADGRRASPRSRGCGAPSSRARRGPPSERTQRNAVWAAEVAPAHEILRRRSRSSNSVPGPPPTASVTWLEPPRSASSADDREPDRNDAKRHRRRPGPVSAEAA